MARKQARTEFILIDRKSFELRGNPYSTARNPLAQIARQPNAPENRSGPERYWRLQPPGGSLRLFNKGQAGDRRDR
jgi:hypothetical protein